MHSLSPASGQGGSHASQIWCSPHSQTETRSTPTSVTATLLLECDTRWQIFVPSGFASQVHFSRAYRARFGLPPRQDRIEGRVPFEFRAWPMHRKTV